jgi:hypothetical protein
MKPNNNVSSLRNAAGSLYNKRDAIANDSSQNSIESDEAYEKVHQMLQQWYALSKAFLMHRLAKDVGVEVAPLGIAEARLKVIEAAEALPTEETIHAAMMLRLGR